MRAHDPAAGQPDQGPRPASALHVLSDGTL